MKTSDRLEIIYLEYQSVDEIIKILTEMKDKYREYNNLIIQWEYGWDDTRDYYVWGGERNDKERRDGEEKRDRTLEEKA